MKTIAEAKAEIAGIFQSLRETYGLRALGKDALKMTVKMWWPYSADRLREAIGKLPSDQRFYPTPGQLRGYVQHKSPSGHHRLVDKTLSGCNPNQRARWNQAQIDYVCESLGIPDGFVKEGDI